MPPRIVREMSWVCNYWPENVPYPYTSSDRSTLSALDRPEIQRYCLMSIKDSFTDFHIDFGGTSVWYHVLRVSLSVFLLWLRCQFNVCRYKDVPYPGMRSSAIDLMRVEHSVDGDHLFQFVMPTCR